MKLTTTDDRWADYVAAYHAGYAGITETAFDHTRDTLWGTPHDWLAAGVPGPAGAVLDVACGSAAMHERLEFETYLGVDLSKPELDVARSRGRGRLAVADARSLPVADQGVDTVVCSMGLMLVRPVEAALNEAARVLRPAGRLALLLRSVWPLGAHDVKPLLALAVSRRGPGAMPQHFGRRRIGTLLRAAGFVVESVQRYRFGFPLRGEADVRLAVSSLYTPGRSAEHLRRAERRLTRQIDPAAQVGLPLMRVVARRGSTASHRPAC